MSNQPALLERIRTCQKSDAQNRKCLVCHEPGATYVCMDHGSFLCSTCSGLHREYNFKIKGVSLSQWTSTEVAFIEKNGNQRVRDSFLKHYKEDHFNAPSPGNTERLRHFIRSAFVEKRWMSNRERGSRSNVSTKQRRINSPKDDERRNSRTDKSHSHHKRDPRKEKPRKSSSAWTEDMLFFDESHVHKSKTRVHANDSSDDLISNSASSMHDSVTPVVSDSDASENSDEQFYRIRPKKKTAPKESSRNVGNKSRNSRSRPEKKKYGDQSKAGVLSNSFSRSSASSLSIEDSKREITSKNVRNDHNGYRQESFASFQQDPFSPKSQVVSGGSSGKAAPLNPFTTFMPTPDALPPLSVALPKPEKDNDEFSMLMYLDQQSKAAAKYSASVTKPASGVPVKAGYFEETSNATANTHPTTCAFYPDVNKLLKTTKLTSLSRKSVDWNVATEDEKLTYFVLMRQKHLAELQLLSLEESLSSRHPNKGVESNSTFSLEPPSAIPLKSTTMDIMYGYSDIAGPKKQDTENSSFQHQQLMFETQEKISSIHSAQHTLDAAAPAFTPGMLTMIQLTSDTTAISSREGSMNMEGHNLHEMSAHF